MFPMMQWFLPPHKKQPRSSRNFERLNGFQERHSCIDKEELQTNSPGNIRNIPDSMKIVKNGFWLTSSYQIDQQSHIYIYIYLCVLHCVVLFCCFPPVLLRCLLVASRCFVLLWFALRCFVLLCFDLGRWSQPRRPQEPGLRIRDSLIHLPHGFGMR